MGISVPVFLHMQPGKPIPIQVGTSTLKLPYRYREQLSWDIMT